MIKIDDRKFNNAHVAFKKRMLKASNGERFVGFNHAFLYEDEIRYKHAVHEKASKALQLNKWRIWKKKPGKIRQALREACAVSDNLLEHRYGPKGNSDSPLYMNATDNVGELEKHFIDFFQGDGEIEDRFDSLAKYVRVNKLGSKWPFFSYLVFLYNPQQYFPILSGPFDRLLNYYGANETISRKQITWKRYSVLLNLAEALKEKLVAYGPINAIQIQSYMWVVSNLIKDDKVLETDTGSTPEIDFSAELDTRYKKAQERERIGLLGEQFVFEQEKEKLKKSGFDQLAEQVKLVSSESAGFGYDVLSFDEDGQEIHIEVKTTTRSPSFDNGFWLSNNEKKVAEADGNWCIYRVWNIDTQPSHENTGNVVLENNLNWQLRVSNWHVKYRL